MSGETKREPWVMPDWMKPYREMIDNTGGNPVEELVNDRDTNARSNMIRAALIVSVESQVALLYRLHKAGRVDRDRGIREAMTRSESCEHHGEEIKSLTAQLHALDRAGDKSEAGRIALLGLLHAVQEMVRAPGPDLTVTALLDVLGKASKKAADAHARAWSK